MNRKWYLFNAVVFWLIGFVLLYAGDGFAGLACSILGTLFLVCYEIKNSRIIVRHTHYKTREGDSD